MGAFAAIWLGCYFIAQLALAVTAAQMQADLTALAFGYLYQQKPFRACSCELPSCEKQWSGIYFCRVRG